MSTYTISSDAGDLGTYAAAAPLGALDAMARDAGYADHAAACAALSMRGDDWTTDLHAVTRGGVTLYVFKERGTPYDVAYHDGVARRAA